jgi:hypothetical protein
MKKQPLLMLAVTGVLLAAGSQAQAQITYNNEDLLLNFRNATATTDPNVTVDLGNVNSFVSTVAALPGGTAVLDTGSGFTASLPSGFNYSGLTAVLGAPASGNVIGFSAAAADNVSSTLWLSRTQSGLTPPAHKSLQGGSGPQGNTATAIGNIGAEAAGVNGDTIQLTGSGVNAVSYPSGDSYSYQSQGQGPGTPGVISYGGSQFTSAAAGGVLESAVDGSANVYEALWEVPVSGTGSDTYEGYFTFQPDGEVDFTTTAVPEPSMYALLVATGVVMFAFRRKIRRLIA